MYGLPKTLYNRFVRWSRMGVFARIFVEFARPGPDGQTIMTDSTYLKAHRTAGSLSKGGRAHGPSELMRWMPPPSGISYAMMVPLEPNGGHIDDDDDQHAGDRPGEGQTSKSAQSERMGRFYTTAYYRGSA